MGELLDPRARDRLAKLCGMFGSAHIGERAAAAAMANRLVREELKLTWRDVIAAAQLEAPTFGGEVREKINLVRAHPEVLTEWEQKFINSIDRTWRFTLHLSPKQFALLDKLVTKVRTSREKGGRELDVATNRPRPRRQNIRRSGSSAGAGS